MERNSSKIGTKFAQMKLTSQLPNLEYPKHPFTPALCAQVSNLPEGFRELTLS